MASALDRTTPFQWRCGGNERQDQVHQSSLVRLRRRKELHSCHLSLLRAFRSRSNADCTFGIAARKSSVSSDTGTLNGCLLTGIQFGDMDSVTGGAISTVAAVLLTHWMGQRTGKKRSDQVRDEIYLRLNAIDFRLTEVERGLTLRIYEARVDSIEAIHQVKSDLQGSPVLVEAPNRLQERNGRAQTAGVNGGYPGSTSTTH
jgi:hypothetical protein